MFSVIYDLFQNKTKNKNKKKQKPSTIDVIVEWTNQLHCRHVHCRTSVQV